MSGQSVSFVVTTSTLLKQSSCVSSQVLLVTSKGIRPSNNSSQQTTLIDYKIPGNRLYELDKKIYLREKTPAELVGEKVLLPVVNMAKRIFSDIYAIMSKIDRYMSFPTAAAEEIPIGTVAYFDLENCPE